MTKNKDKVNPLWGGRFKEGVSNLTQSFTSSVDIDKALYEVDIKGSIAYAETLKEAKVIIQKEFLKIKKGLVKIKNFQKSKDKVNHIKYIITPKGISLRTKLTITFMQKKMKEYDDLKSEIKY